MKILASRQFLEEARLAPAPLIEYLKQATGEGRPRGVRPGPENSRARRIDPARVLGLSQDPDKLKLWFYVAPEKIEPVSDPPLATLERSALRTLGVPVNLIEQVQRLVQLKDLESLAMADDVKEQLRFRFLQLGAALPASDAELVRRAHDAGHLLDFLRGNITDLVLNLDPSQERVVNLGHGGTIVVRGVAGSGKTSVALHRIHRLLSQASTFRPPRILFLTYNRSLATACRELLTALGGAAVRDVEVQTLHKWCMEFADISAHRMLSPKARKARVEQAIAKVKKDAAKSPLWKYPISFWEEELQRMKGRSVGGEADYLTMSRQGAQRALGPTLRPLVWKVYLQYLAECHPCLDWDDVVRRASSKLAERGDTAPRYDYVFVDEAQDLTVRAIQVAATLARPPGELFVAFDAAQSIYQREFRWKDAGVTVHGGRSFNLRQNFRNTAQILDAARPLLAAVHRDHTAREGETSDLLEPQAGVREGTPPRHLACDARNEAAVIAKEIRRLVEHEGVRPNNIAVLAYPNRVKSAIFHSLQNDHGVICQQHDHDTEILLGDPSVKVLPMRSAKGLEFPVVFVAAAGRNFKPSNAMDEREAATYVADMRRVFYVALTRAMSRLFLVYPPDDPPTLLLHHQDAPARRALELELEPVKNIASPELAEEIRLGELFVPLRIGWTKFLTQLGLPSGIGIRKDMTLAEARRLAAKKSAAAASPQRPASPARSEYFVAQGKTKFHRPDCTWVKPNSCLQTFQTREDAIRVGLVPCSTCRP